VVAAWFLTVVLAQTPDIQDDTSARLQYELGLWNRRDAETANAAAQAFRFAADHLARRANQESPALQFTLGNARFLSGDLPHAIAAYRRGLALDPADAKLRAALAYAREQVQYPPGPDLVALLRPERDLWPPWLSLRYLGVYAFALYFAGCLAATRWRMTRRRRWFVAAGVMLAVAAVPAVGTGVEWWRARRDAAEPIVVVARDVPLRAGNGPEYPPRLDAPLPRGCEVRQLFERGGWVQVETGGGAVGWVPRDVVVGDV
jgi:hypothetical protein